MIMYKPFSLYFIVGGLGSPFIMFFFVHHVHMIFVYIIYIIVFVYDDTYSIMRNCPSLRRIKYICYIFISDG